MDRNISRFKFAGHIPAVEKTRASWQMKPQFLVSFSLFSFFFLILLSFPGDSNCERQALFTGWSELTPGAIAGALCSWREAGGAEEMLQARLWLSKAHTHKGRNISCLCSNLTVFSGGKLRIYKWGPNHRKWSSMLYLPQAPSVCVSAWREAPSSSRAQVSPPQQMLQKGDTSRG